jgi:hypothetical protein
MGLAKNERYFAIGLDSVVFLRHNCHVGTFTRKKEHRCRWVLETRQSSFLTRHEQKCSFNIELS